MSMMTTVISLARRLRQISKNIEDAKLAMADIQIKALDKDKEIEVLKEKLKNKIKTVVKYYKL